MVDEIVDAGYLPSEVARLVLGYLERSHCTRTMRNFFMENVYLEESRILSQKGRDISTCVNGCQLEDILRQHDCFQRNISKLILWSHKLQPDLAMELQSTVIKDLGLSRFSTPAYSDDCRRNEPSIETRRRSLNLWSKSAKSKKFDTSENILCVQEHKMTRECGTVTDIQLPPWYSSTISDYFCPDAQTTANPDVCTTSIVAPAPESAGAPVPASSGEYSRKWRKKRSPRRRHNGPDDGYPMPLSHEAVEVESFLDTLIMDKADTIAQISSRRLMGDTEASCHATGDQAVVDPLEEFLNSLERQSKEEVWESKPELETERSLQTPPLSTFQPAEASELNERQEVHCGTLEPFLENHQPAPLEQRRNVFQLLEEQAMPKITSLKGVTCFLESQRELNSSVLETQEPEVMGRDAGMPPMAPSDRQEEADVELHESLKEEALASATALREVDIASEAMVSWGNQETTPQCMPKAMEELVVFQGMPETEGQKAVTKKNSCIELRTSARTRTPKRRFDEEEVSLPTNKRKHNRRAKSKEDSTSAAGGSPSGKLRETEPSPKKPRMMGFPPTDNVYVSVSRGKRGRPRKNGRSESDGNSEVAKCRKPDDEKAMKEDFDAGEEEKPDKKSGDKPSGKQDERPIETLIEGSPVNKRRQVSCSRGVGDLTSESNEVTTINAKEVRADGVDKSASGRKRTGRTKKSGPRSNSGGKRVTENVNDEMKKDAALSLSQCLSEDAGEQKENITSGDVRNQKNRRLRARRHRIPAKKEQETISDAEEGQGKVTDPRRGELGVSNASKEENGDGTKRIQQRLNSNVRHGTPSTSIYLSERQSARQKGRGISRNPPRRPRYPAWFQPSPRPIFQPSPRPISSRLRFKSTQRRENDSFSLEFPPSPPEEREESSSHAPDTSGHVFVKPKTISRRKERNKTVKGRRISKKQRNGEGKTKNEVETLIHDVTNVQGLNGSTVEREKSGNPIEEPQGSPIQSVLGNPMQELQGNPMQELEGNPMQELEGNPMQEVEGNPMQEVEGNPMKELEGNPMQELEGNPMQELEGNPMKELEGNPMQEVEGNPMKELQGNPMQELEGNPMQEVEGNPMKELQGNPIQELEGNPMQELEGNPMQELEGNPMQELQGNPMQELEGNPMQELEGNPMKELQVNSMQELEGNPMQELDSSGGEEETKKRSKTSVRRQAQRRNDFRVGEGGSSERSKTPVRRKTRRRLFVNEAAVALDNFETDAHELRQNPLKPKVAARSQKYREDSLRHRMEGIADDERGNGCSSLENWVASGQNISMKDGEDIEMRSNEPHSLRAGTLRSHRQQRARRRKIFSVDLDASSYEEDSDSMSNFSGETIAMCDSNCGDFPVDDLDLKDLEAGDEVPEPCSISSGTAAPAINPRPTLSSQNAGTNSKRDDSAICRVFQVNRATRVMESKIIFPPSRVKQAPVESHVENLSSSEEDTGEIRESFNNTTSSARSPVEENRSGESAWPMKKPIGMCASPETGVSDLTSENEGSPEDKSSSRVEPVKTHEDPAMTTAEEPQVATVAEEAAMVTAAEEAQVATAEEAAVVAAGEEATAAEEAAAVTAAEEAAVATAGEEAQVATAAEEAAVVAAAEEAQVVTAGDRFPCVSSAFVNLSEWLTKTDENLESQVHFQAPPAQFSEKGVFVAESPHGDGSGSAMDESSESSEEADDEAPGGLLTPNSARLMAEKGEELARMLTAESNLQREVSGVSQVSNPVPPSPPASTTPDESYESDFPDLEGVVENAQNSSAESGMDEEEPAGRETEDVPGIESSVGGGEKSALQSSPCDAGAMNPFAMLTQSLKERQPKEVTPPTSEQSQRNPLGKMNIDSFLSSLYRK